MKIYRISEGLLVQHKKNYYLIETNWDIFINDDQLYNKLLSFIKLRKAKEVSEIKQYPILAPIGVQELWAAGVTYYKSKEARIEESKDQSGGSFYDNVYHADRPELFFKSNGYRVKGYGEEIRIRKDSNWNVPEPELTLLISSKQKILGYTIGNDVSSRAIEGENPLYLAQAKTYNGSAALGPCIWLPDENGPVHLAISMSIIREKNCIFEGHTTTGEMKRSPEELVSYLYKELDFPDACFLMTGTGIIPPDDFTLASKDEVVIFIEEIGSLRNVVE